VGARSLIDFSLTMTDPKSALETRCLWFVSAALQKACLHSFLLVVLAACSKPTPQPRTATPEETRRYYPELYARGPAIVVGNTDPGPACEYLGEVTADESESRDPYEQLKERALELHGNYLLADGTRVSRITWGYRIKSELKGRVFRCAAMPVTVPPPSMASVPQVVCEPPCSPGYTCVRATCVSACNPPCGENAQCGVDRICHPEK
jgi:hypothetical protein